MKESNERIIERIRKLLAMANDTSSPHEAAIAAERARKLMDAHQLDYDDIDFSDNDFNEMTAGGSYVNYPLWKQNLAVNIANLNDCIAKFHPAGRRKYIQFQGFSTDVELCRYMFDYLVYAGESQYKTYTRNTGNSGNSIRDVFLKNFGYAVADKIKAMIKERATVKTTSGRDLVVVKSALVAERFGKGEYRSSVNRRRYTDDELHARNAGAEAGKRTSIHRGVNHAEGTRAISHAG